MVEFIDGYDQKTTKQLIATIEESEYDIAKYERVLDYERDNLDRERVKVALFDKLLVRVHSTEEGYYGGLWFDGPETKTVRDSVRIQDEVAAGNLIYLDQNWKQRTDEANRILDDPLGHSQSHLPSASDELYDQKLNHDSRVQFAGATLGFLDGSLTGGTRIDSLLGNNLEIKDGKLSSYTDIDEDVDFENFNLEDANLIGAENVEVQNPPTKDVQVVRLSELNDHTATSEAHHDRYTDVEAVSAVETLDRKTAISITGDAQTLRGESPSTLTQQFFDVSGDTITGTAELKVKDGVALRFSDGSDGSISDPHRISSGSRGIVFGVNGVDDVLRLKPNSDVAVTNGNVVVNGYRALTKEDEGSINAGTVGEVGIEGILLDDNGTVAASNLNFDPTTQQELDTHTDVTSAHHSRYENSEAINAINSLDQIDVSITGDASTVGGLEPNQLSKTKSVAQYTSSNDTVDINTSSFVKIPWDTTHQEDAAYTMSADGTTLTFEQTGTFMTYVSLAIASDSDGVSPEIKFFLNGNSLEGSGRSGYIGSSADHSSSSNSIQRLIDASEGDTLTIQSSISGGAGSVNLIPMQSILMLDQVSQTTALADDADTLDGYHGSDYALKSQDQVVSGIWEFGSDGNRVAIDNSVIYNPSSDKKIDFSKPNVEITGGLAINGGASVDGSGVLTHSDEGDGNNLDADTVDGVESEQMVRSDKESSISGETKWEPGFRPALLFDSSANDPSSNALFEFYDTSSGEVRTAWFGWFSGNNGVTIHNTQSGTELSVEDTVKVNGSRILTTDDEGSVDAGSLGSHDSDDYARKNVSQTITANWTIDSLLKFDDGHGYSFGTNDDWRVYRPAGNSDLKIYDNTNGVFVMEASQGGPVNFANGIRENGNSVLTTADSDGSTIDAGSLGGVDASAYFEQGQSKGLELGHSTGEIYGYIKSPTNRGVRVDIRNNDVSDAFEVRADLSNNTDPEDTILKANAGGEVDIPNGGLTVSGDIVSEGDSVLTENDRSDFVSIGGNLQSIGSILIPGVGKEKMTLRHMNGYYGDTYDEAYVFSKIDDNGINTEGGFVFEEANGDSRDTTQELLSIHHNHLRYMGDEVLTTAGGLTITGRVDFSSNGNYISGSTASFSNLDSGGGAEIDLEAPMNFNEHNAKNLTVNGSEVLTTAGGQSVNGSLNVENDITLGSGNHADRFVALRTGEYGARVGYSTSGFKNSSNNGLMLQAGNGKNVAIKTNATNGFGSGVVNLDAYPSGDVLFPTGDVLLRGGVHSVDSDLADVDNKTKPVVDVSFGGRSTALHGISAGNLADAAGTALIAHSGGSGSFAYKPDGEPVRFTVAANGYTSIGGNLSVDGAISLDNQGAIRNASGIFIDPNSNPGTGSPLMDIRSSGGSERLRVEHNGLIGTDNQVFTLGMSNDGGTQRIYFGDRSVQIYGASNGEISAKDGNGNITIIT